MARKFTFSGGTHTTLRQNFYQRLRYKNFVDSLDGKLIDTLYNKKTALYGKINLENEVTAYLGSAKTMKEFSGLNPGVYVLNFVHDAFMGFREEYLNLESRSVIDFPPFLKGMVPVRGHESFEEKYGNYITFTAATYVSRLEDDATIQNFRDFITAFKKTAKRETQQFPITKSGFALSRFNEVSTTGLVIELANLSYDVDTKKGEILQSPECECYINVANRHGFMIDAHAPWRLYADLENPVMQYLIRIGGMISYHYVIVIVDRLHIY